MSAGASASTSSTPQRSATARTRATGSSTRWGLPCTTTAAVLTGGIGDHPVEVGRELCVLVVDEVEDELMVAFRAWKAGVYDALRRASARKERFRNFAHDAMPNRGVAHDAFRG